MIAGSIHAESSRDLMRGPRTNTPSYSAIHKWLVSNHPKTGVCERCHNAVGKTDYALRTGEKCRRVREAFTELCRSCHAKIDGTVRNLKGRP